MHVSAGVIVFLTAGAGTQFYDCATKKITHMGTEARSNYAKKMWDRYCAPLLCGPKLSACRCEQDGGQATDKIVQLPCLFAGECQYFNAYHIHRTGPDVVNHTGREG